ncbi:unnamed protein product [Peniophora sp. CBMAI 1063]|nr:unnamed protein product [Peniophora sp. CBMAI 1063]
MVEVEQKAKLMLDDEDDAWVSVHLENGMVSDGEEGSKGAEEGDNTESLSDERTKGRQVYRVILEEPRWARHNRTDDNAALHTEWTRIASDHLFVHLKHLMQDVASPADGTGIHYFRNFVFGANKVYQTIVPRRREHSAAAALARFGCLPGHPARSRVVFEIRGLEQHRQLRRALPSCTAMQWLKAVCQFSHMIYRKSLQKSSKLALEAYLAVLRDIQKLVKRS